MFGMSSEIRAQPALSSQPVVAFAGPLGCGKTEVAVAYALLSLSCGRPTCIIDLDVVTPYFRVGDYREQLGAQGLRVVAPRGSLASFELPALPPEIAGAIDQEGLHVVLDVGGDPVGSQLLGAYECQLSDRGYDLWMVVNPFRPSAATPDLLVGQARAIERSCSLRLTGLVANPHLGPLTKEDQVRTGWEIAREAAQRLALPVVFLALEGPLVQSPPSSAVAVLPLERVVRLPWESA
jgi:hypothetical protein